MRRMFNAAIAVVLLASGAQAASGSIHVSGTGTLDAGRTFVVNALIMPDGSVNGHATLINRNFSGDRGKGPYIAQIDISCAKQLDDSTIIIGGMTTTTNDSNLQDAVFFSVRDNGTDGDQVSRAYFWDGDPDTVGDPGSCQLSTLDDVPLEDIQAGNIKVQ